VGPDDDACGFSKAAIRSRKEPTFFGGVGLSDMVDDGRDEVQGRETKHNHRDSISRNPHTTCYIRTSLPCLLSLTEA